MSKYYVKVPVVEHVVYRVEVEADSEEQAQILGRDAVRVSAGRTDKRVNYFRLPDSAQDCMAYTANCDSCGVSVDDPAPRSCFYGQHTP